MIRANRLSRKTVMEEKELVERVLKGESLAEEEFFKTYRPRLMRCSYFFLGARDPETEDVVQQTFLIAFPKLKDYDFRAPIYAWLKRICVNLCYERLRHRKRVLASLDEDLEVYTRDAARLKQEAGDAEAEKAFLLALVAELQATMDETSRRILRLRDVEGKSYSEISRILEIPIGTVMSRLARSRQELKKRFQARLKENNLNQP
jgi:RNA polymerase sigma-70 factor (ECF subfamily)